MYINNQNIKKYHKKKSLTGFTIPPYNLFQKTPVRMTLQWNMCKLHFQIVQEIPIVFKHFKHCY